MLWDFNKLHLSTALGFEFAMDDASHCFFMFGENHNLGFAFWFLICGIILILWGETLQYYIRKEQKPAPLFLGYFILLFTIIGCIVDGILISCI